ncbi:MAG: methyltransferase domain-containing protein [Treponemataceae bacterium]|nr:methyltransferase domain-containing protein [Treponemataceae bacterium]
MTVLIVQCRLGSTRLPQKALLPFGNGTLIERTMQVMHCVKADAYCLATDESSFEKLAPLAENNGFDIFAGSQQDVLKRFCDVIRKYNADTVLRATGDNPFLFADAAAESLEVFAELKKNGNCDYFTFSGLPHGSGIEVFDAESLLKAARLTDDPFDHEHVGPALYRHQDTFSCVFMDAPAKWNHPELRTTVDTFGDYRRAVQRNRTASESGVNLICLENSQKILDVIEQSSKNRRQMLVVPQFSKGHGTGHLRRCLQIAAETKCDIFLPAADENFSPVENTDYLVSQYSINPDMIVRTLPEVSQLNDEPCPPYDLVVCDKFMLSCAEAEYFRQLGPLVCIDEGSEFHDKGDYLLDVIPSPLLDRNPNMANPGFVPMPKNNRNCGTEKSVLVVIGGEDPLDVTGKLEKACKKAGFDVTCVTKENPVSNLKEELYKFRTVITHYGFTAFEALGAGCRVILVATTPLHEKLALSYGFPCFSAKDLSSQNAVERAAEKFLQRCNDSDKDLLLNAETFSENNRENDEVPKKLSGFLTELSFGVRRFCPVCKSSSDDEIMARTKKSTFRRCGKCGIIYLSWCCKKESDYQKDYFFSEYKKQYGKTYLEDFDSIKTQGKRRAAIIGRMLGKQRMKTGEKKTVLDVGCAYGPFLQAAAEEGFEPFGTDIAKDAVEYVNTRLGYKSAVSAFPDFDPAAALHENSFDSVTMWYVIEHFADLDSVLTKISSITKDGGVFAFSTPAGDGVSGKFRKQGFFEQSPTDHISIWEKKKCRKILEKYGFSVEKIVSTGHHPERFPFKNASSFSGILLFISRLFRLGDTFEVYCRKNTNAKKI